MTAKNNATPNNVASIKQKKTEEKVVADNTKIPTQTTTETVETIEVTEETKVSVVEKAKDLVKKNRHTILLALSVGAIVLGIRSAKKERASKQDDLGEIIVEDDEDTITTDED